VRRKRAFIYVAAGLVCASVAAWAALKFVSNASAHSMASDGVPVLLATQDIRQGEVIVLAGGARQSNVAFVTWPPDKMPDGAIRDKKDIVDRQLRARTGFVKHEIIQKSRLVSDGDYVPEDMYLQMVKIGDDDLKSGRLRLGMKVDVLQVTSKRPVDFLRCAEISAVGRLDSNGLPVSEKDPPPNVWLLVKKVDRPAFVEAEYSGKLIVVESSDSQCREPYLVDSGDSLQARKKDADAMLARAKALAQTGQYEQALSVLDDLANNYTEIPDVAGKAAAEQTKTRETLAQALYDRANTALVHDKNFSESLRLLDELDLQAPATSPLRGKAASLRTQAQAALEKFRLKTQYEALLAALDDALKTGDLPKARDKQAELEQFSSQQTVQFDDVQQQPAQAAEDYAKRLKSKTTDFSIKKQALEFFLKRSDLQSARDCLADIKKEYAAHPELPGLEQQVRLAEQPSE
jgi:hypothetical protein